METRLSATLAQVIRPLGGWRCRYQSPCSADTAARRWGRGRLICHAADMPAAILALAIPVIQSCFQASLIASIGLSQLFPSGLLPTFCAAVGLSSIAGEADEKHLPAARSAAKQLSKYKRSSHCLPGRSGQWPSRCATLNLVVVVLFYGGHSKRKPRSFLRSGFFTLRLVDSNLPESLRYASAMMRRRDSLSNRAGVFHSSPHRLQQPPLRFGDDDDDLLSNRRVIKKPRFLMRANM